MTQDLRDRHVTDKRPLDGYTERADRSGFLHSRNLACPLASKSSEILPCLSPVARRLCLFASETIDAYSVAPSETEPATTMAPFCRASARDKPVRRQPFRGGHATVSEGDPDNALDLSPVNSYKETSDCGRLSILQSFSCFETAAVTR